VKNCAVFLKYNITKQKNYTKKQNVGSNLACLNEDMHKTSIFCKHLVKIAGLLA